MIMTWWYAADKSGVKRLNRYSYLTDTAARRDNPDAPWIMGNFIPGDHTKSLEGVE